MVKACQLLDDGAAEESWRATGMSPDRPLPHQLQCLRAACSRQLLQPHVQPAAAPEPQRVAMQLLARFQFAPVVPPPAPPQPPRVAVAALPEAPHTSSRIPVLLFGFLLAVQPTVQCIPPVRPLNLAPAAGVAPAPAPALALAVGVAPAPAPAPASASVCARKLPPRQGRP